MLTKVPIRVDCRFFYMQPGKFARGGAILTPAFDLGEILHPPQQRVLGPRFAPSCLGATVLQTRFAPPHFLQTGKPGLANKRLIVPVEMDR